MNIKRWEKDCYEYHQRRSGRDVWENEVNSIDILLEVGEKQKRDNIHSLLVKNSTAVFLKIMWKKIGWFTENCFFNIFIIVRSENENDLLIDYFCCKMD